MAQVLDDHLPPPDDQSLPGIRRPFPISPNEEFWIEVIRHASADTDPEPSLERVHQLRALVRAWMLAAGVR